MKNSIIHLIRYAKERGCTISVNDGGEWAVKRSRNETEIMEAINSVDEAQLRIRNYTGVIAWALVIPELDPDEMVADYSSADGKFMDEWAIAYDQSNQEMVA